MSGDGEERRVMVPRPHDSGDFPPVVIPGSIPTSWGKEVVGRKKKPKPTPGSGVGQRIPRPLTEWEQKMARVLRRKQEEEDEKRRQMAYEDEEQDLVDEPPEGLQTMYGNSSQSHQPRFIARPRQDGFPPVVIPCFHPESFARGWSAVESRQIVNLAEELTKVPSHELYIGMSERSVLFDNLIQKIETRCGAGLDGICLVKKAVLQEKESELEAAHAEIERLRRETISSGDKGKGRANSTASRQEEGQKNSSGNAEQEEQGLAGDKSLEVRPGSSGKEECDGFYELSSAIVTLSTPGIPCIALGPSGESFCTSGEDLEAHSERGATPYKPTYVESATDSME